MIILVKVLLWSCLINFEIKFKYNIASEDDVVKFVNFYMRETNETLKVKVKKKDKPKSIYKINTYMIHGMKKQERLKMC